MARAVVVHVQQVGPYEFFEHVLKKLEQEDVDDEDKVWLEDDSS